MSRNTDTWKQPEIEHNKLTQWNWMVCKPEYLKLGRRVDIGAFVYIMASQGVTIEDDVQIGSHSSIMSVNTIDMCAGEIIIKKGACIGAHSVILPRCDGKPLVIGEKAKCGAYSLIKNDIPAGAFVKGGNHRAKIQWF